MWGVVGDRRRLASESGCSGKGLRLWGEEGGEGREVLGKGLRGL